MKALLKFFLLFYFCLMCVGCDSPARLASADLRSCYVFYFFKLLTFKFILL